MRIARDQQRQRLRTPCGRGRDLGRRTEPRKRASRGRVAVEPPRLPLLERGIKVLPQLVDDPRSFAPGAAQRQLDTREMSFDALVAALSFTAHDAVPSTAPTAEANSRHSPRRSRNASRPAAVSA